MRAWIFTVVAVGCVSACTYATVSATPVQLSDGSLAYRYSGRDNFAHQKVEADRAMADTCASVGGHPVIIDQSSGIIGAGAMFGTGTATIMANRQQEILFKCVP